MGPSGTLKVNNLPVYQADGTTKVNYTVTEVNQPNRYVSPVTATVQLAAGGNVNANLTNTLKMFQIELTKVGDTITGYEEEDTDFGTKYVPVIEDVGLPNATYGLYAIEDIETADGVTHYEKDELIEEITTDENGVITTSSLYGGEYYLQELEAPEGYYVDDTKHIVSCNDYIENKAIIKVEQHVTDKRQQMVMRFMKAIEDNEVYPNPEAYQDIVFGVYSRNPILDRNGDEMLEADQLLEVLTVSPDEAENGTVTYLVESEAEYYFGDYYVKELQTAEGWNLNETEYDFTFEPVTEEKPEEPIEPGEPTEPEEPTDPGDPIEEEPEDLRFVIDLNELYGEITNTVIRGNIKFQKWSKYDAEILSQGFENKPLTGAVYGAFRASDDELIATADPTDEYGYSDISSLAYGEYYLKEIKAPVNYKSDDTKYFFTIEDEGITLELKVENEAKIGDLELNKDGTPLGDTLAMTGDSSIWFAVFCSSVSLILIAGILVYRKRRENQ
jgi:uncharacterized surface anchored protein